MIFMIIYYSVSQPPGRGAIPGPGRERSEETTVCYKISLVQLITNLNVILYLSTCHTVYISILIIFMIMPLLNINTYVSLMYELKKLERYLRVNLFGPVPRLMKKKNYWAAVSQSLRNTDLLLHGYMFRLLRVIITPSNELDSLDMWK